MSIFNLLKTIYKYCIERTHIFSRHLKTDELEFLISYLHTQIYPYLSNNSSRVKTTSMFNL